MRVPRTRPAARSTKRMLAGLILTSALTACGYKGPLYLPPPPPPDAALTTPPPAPALLPGSSEPGSGTVTSPVK